jgi:acetyl-CoA carboxylase biotin carboxylase subunit
VPPYYDSLIGKLIVHAPSREEAIARLRRALDEMVVGGVETTLPLHRLLVNNDDIQAGEYEIHWLVGFLKSAKDGGKGARKC